MNWTTVAVICDHSTSAVAFGSGRHDYVSIMSRCTKPSYHTAINMLWFCGEVEIKRASRYVGHEPARCSYAATRALPGVQLMLFNMHHERFRS
jgi:hypothetical protein